MLVVIIIIIIIIIVVQRLRGPSSMRYKSTVLILIKDIFIGALLLVVATVAMYS
jgi:type III secretory pathway component EscT